MHRIRCILFEPVGCLAEFPPERFQEIAARCFQGRMERGEPASASYWRLVDLMEAHGAPAGDIPLEVEAAGRATLYEDVRPSLAELNSMGVRLCVASSLSSAAVTAFLERHSLGGFFSSVCSRDSAGGVKAAPLRCALGGLAPEEAAFLTDTSGGLKTARAAGVNGVLMMNDPDESRRLALENPAGGIVSLHELPDFVRLLASRE